MLNAQLKYLQNLERFTKIEPGLSTIRKLLNELDNPQKKFRSIHIAGTNGKGSTAAFLNSIFNQSNLKIGLYTSPHMRHFNERIIVNNKQISNSNLSHCISQVKDTAKKTKINPTYFEFTTALAFLYFAHQNTELAIVEVGMGGKLDATNIINPILTIITNIDIDHTQWLGHTKKDIASRKAGIIKNNTPLITAETDPDTLSFLENKCLEKKAPFHSLKGRTAINITTRSLTKQTFNISGFTDNTYTIPLLGDHQTQNATTAIYATQHLKQTYPKLIKLTPPQIKQGLADTKWEGRSDIISFKPFILLDGAHNEAGLTALSETLNTYPFPKPDVLIIGLKKDKNPKPLLDKIIPRFHRIIATESNHQPLPATKLADQIKKHFPDPKYKVEVISNPIQAINTGKKYLQPNSMLLITGSLYLVGDCLAILQK